jgi:hypothetical protein
MGKADAQATFEINLEDGTSKTAESAAGALKKLQASIQADNAALRQMQAAMKNLQGGSSVNIEQFQKLKQQIDAKKQSIASAQSSYISLGGSLTGVKGKSEAAKNAFAEMQKNAQSLPGPVGDIANGFARLKGMLAGGGIALGVAAIALAVVALTAATVAAVASLFQYGLAQGNAARAELLRLEGLTKMRNWHGIAAGSATEMQNAIDKVSASSALGRDKVGQYSEQLYKAGLRGENLAVALEAASIKASVQGDAAASAFVGWAAGANLAGRSVKALADDVKARLGGIAARQMLDLDVQSKKLHESYAALFTGIDFESVLGALKGVTDLFSQSTYSGKALKTIVTVMFKPMIATVEYLGPLLKRFFQGLIIGALQLSIVLLKVRKWWREAFGDATVLGNMDKQNAALKLGTIAVKLIGAAFVLTGALIVGALIAAMPFIWAAVVAVGALAIQGLILAAPFILAAVAIVAVIAAGYQLYRLWKEIDWKSLGSAIVDGIVNGLKAGAQWVVDAVTDLGTSAMKALKDTLGISSPSKVFAKLGLSLPQGVTAGVEAGTPGARRAVANIVDAPSIPAVPSSPAGAPAPNSAQKTVTINVGDVNVTAQDGQQATSIAADIKRELMRVLEGVAFEIGASPA